MGKVYSFSIEPDFNKAELLITVVESEEAETRTTYSNSDESIIGKVDIPVRTWVTHLPMRLLE